MRSIRTVYQVYHEIVMSLGRHVQRVLVLETLIFALTACCTMCALKIILSQDLASKMSKKTDGRFVQWIYEPSIHSAYSFICG